jgi:hypothetical protein
MTIGTVIEDILVGLIYLTILAVILLIAFAIGAFVSHFPVAGIIGLFLFASWLIGWITRMSK